MTEALYLEREERSLRGEGPVPFSVHETKDVGCCCCVFCVALFWCV